MNNKDGWVSIPDWVMDASQKEFERPGFNMVAFVEDNEPFLQRKKRRPRAWRKLSVQSKALYLLIVKHMAEEGE